MCPSERTSGSERYPQISVAYATCIGFHSSYAHPGDYAKRPTSGTKASLRIGGDEGTSPPRCAQSHDTCDTAGPPARRNTGRNVPTGLLDLAGPALRIEADGPLLVAASPPGRRACDVDRKSTRLNSSHANISYAVFCLKKN